MERRLVLPSPGGDFLSRKGSKADYERGCDAILADFMAAGAAQLPDLHSVGRAEAWAVGRHYGLLSPYLDWSRSPFVAAFFAFMEVYNSLQRAGLNFGVPDVPVCVWALTWTKGEMWDDDFEKFEIAASRFAPRIHAQSSVFTRLTNGKFVDVRSFLRARGMANALTLYSIPGRDAIGALGDLRLMNITPATLFPDLEGAARMANADWDELDQFALPPSFPPRPFPRLWFDERCGAPWEIAIEQDHVVASGLLGSVRMKNTWSSVDDMTEAELLYLVRSSTYSPMAAAWNRRSDARG